MCGELKEKAQLYCEPTDFISHKTQLTNMKDRERQEGKSVRLSLKRLLWSPRDTGTQLSKRQSIKA